MWRNDSRRATVHILGDAKEPHLVIAASHELNTQTPLAEVTRMWLSTRRTWASTVQDLPLLLIAFLSVMAAHVSLFPKLVTTIVQ